jgi:hypothetical protein
MFDGFAAVRPRNILAACRHMPSTGLGLGYLVWKERGLRGTKAGSVERAACPIHVPGEDPPALIQNHDLAEISRFSEGAP